MEVLASAVTIRGSVLSPSSTDCLPRRSQAAPSRRRSVGLHNSVLTRQHEGLRTLSTVDVLRPLSLSDGFDVAVVSRLEVGKSSGQQRRGIVTAVFERFTERAIKSVMLAQREAKASGDVRLEQSSCCWG